MNENTEGELNDLWCIRLEIFLFVIPHKNHSDSTDNKPKASNCDMQGLQGMLTMNQNAEDKLKDIWRIR